MQGSFLFWKNAESSFLSLIFEILFKNLIMSLQFGIIGGGSWATALAKILTDNKHPINWWIRNTEIIQNLQKRGNNLHYLSSVDFNTGLLSLTDDIGVVIKNSDILVMAIPSAYVEQSISTLPAEIWKNKRVVSAVKGLLPGKNVLLNEFLLQQFQFPLENYFAVLGPCHAEEVASEKLSYLTISGIDLIKASEIATHFNTEYINTIVNPDILGVQYAAVLKNIYALGAGMAHGLDYGDNFLSVYIANAADEMAGFLKNSGSSILLLVSIQARILTLTVRRLTMQLPFIWEICWLPVIPYLAAIVLLEA